MSVVPKDAAEFHQVVEKMNTNVDWEMSPGVFVYTENREVVIGVVAVPNLDEVFPLLISNIVNGEFAGAKPYIISFVAEFEATKLTDTGVERREYRVIHTFSQDDLVVTALRRGDTEWGTNEDVGFQEGPIVEFIRSRQAEIQPITHDKHEEESHADHQDHHRHREQEGRRDEGAHEGAEPQGDAPQDR